MMKSMSSCFHGPDSHCNIFLKIKRTYQFLTSQNLLTPDGQQKISEYVIMMKIAFNLHFPQ